MDLPNDNRLVTKSEEPIVNDLIEKFTTRVYGVGLVSGFLAGFSIGVLGTVYCFYRINKTALQNLLMKALLQK
jgi:prolipoprotein diacylglyceryltransferase